MHTFISISELYMLTYRHFTCTNSSCDFAFSRLLYTIGVKQFTTTSVWVEACHECALKIEHLFSVHRCLISVVNLYLSNKVLANVRRRYICNTSHQLRPYPDIYKIGPSSRGMSMPSCKDSVFLVCSKNWKPLGSTRCWQFTLTMLGNMIYMVFEWT